ncbi:hypothetical protein K456DRAFT_51637 [Colletotrichum gloeosporioides 23]|nr:hypothetical protein K456DRAFT_51637 [Colletotrichum gloeosporioides 23]
MQAILLQHSVKHPSPPEPHVTTSRRHSHHPIQPIPSFQPGSSLCWAVPCRWFVSGHHRKQMLPDIPLSAPKS